MSEREIIFSLNFSKIFKIDKVGKFAVEFVSNGIIS